MESLFDVSRWTSLFHNMDDLLSGLWITFQVAMFGLLLALLLGIVFGILSCSHLKVNRGIARIYVEFFQNTPLVVQVFFYYNALPLLSKSLLFSPYAIGILAVGIYHGAYISEVVRTGITSIPKGQGEAAHSQGFTYTQTMLYIILPQAVKVILPPLTNQALNLVKNTSVLQIIAGGDLMYHADNWASTTGYTAQGYLFAGAAYFLICFPLATLAKKLEARAKQQSPQVCQTMQATLLVTMEVAAHDE